MAAPSKPLPDAPNGFTRAVSQVNLKPIFSSSCDYCGLRFAARAAESVREEEEEHREYCREIKSASERLEQP